MEKEIRLENIVLTYCPHCYNYEIRHDPDLVFHGMRVRYLKSFPNLIITPKQNLKNDFYKACKYYSYYLGNPKIHLSSLDRAGLSNTNYGVHFAFRLSKLKESEKSLLYINGNLWDFLAFYSLSEKERAKREKRLFLKDYLYVPGKTWAEVILDKVDLRNSEFAITYSKKAYEQVNLIKPHLKNNLKIYRGDALRDIVKKYMKK